MALTNQEAQAHAEAHGLTGVWKLDGDVYWSTREDYGFGAARTYRIVSITASLYRIAIITACGTSSLWAASATGSRDMYRRAAEYGATWGIPVNRSTNDKPFRDNFYS